MLRTGHVCFGAKIRDKEDARKKVQYWGHRSKPVHCTFYVSSKLVHSELYWLEPCLQMLDFSPVCPPTTCILASIPEVTAYMGAKRNGIYIHVNPQVGWLGNDKITCVRLFSLYRLHHMCVGANLRAKGRQAGKETQRHKEENSNGFSLSSGQSICTFACVPVPPVSKSNWPLRGDRDGALC